MAASNSTKWKITFFSAFLFLIVVNPYMYQLTQRLFGTIVGKIAESNGCPTFLGLFIHTIVYILLVRGSMDLNLFRD
jgi:hypothetical protein